MSYLYNITDSEDNSLLITIETNNEAKAELTSIKEDTDRIWYMHEDVNPPLSAADKEVVDSTINGDWTEIFITLLNRSGIAHKQVILEEI
jgi:hypothetical protein